MEQKFSVTMYIKRDYGSYKRVITGTPRQIEIAVAISLHNGWSFKRRNLRTETRDIVGHADVQTSLIP
jgi:hypothetical protein